MPIQTYQCEACRREFDRLIRTDADIPVTCPCGEGGLKRVPSAPAVNLKGDGWYKPGFVG